MSNSIGDLRNSGNQGNNFPWQLKVLQGLEAIANSTSGSLTCADQVSLCVNGTVVDASNALPVSVTETNDSIQVFASDGLNNVPVLVGQQDCSDSLAVTLCTQQAGVQITPNIQVLSGVIGFLPDAVYSISFANVGTVPITLSFDGGITQVTIPVGVTINMDAGGLGNQYPPNTFAWDTDFVGASLIITYNTPTP